jgi:protein-S-isoprenylcysteine O-methyltransferase Ste14
MESTATTRLGTLLFKLRSFTPVPLIALLGWELWRTRAAPGPGGPTVDAMLDVAGILVALAGQTLRFYTLAQARDGTSGQDDVLEAKALNTRGPYAHVRNPLYLGNLGICLGLMLVANDAWVYVLGLAFFFGQYFFIIRAEEAFLRTQHGAAYEEFLARVPRWIPRLTPAYEGKLNARFDWSRGLKKEHNPFAAWASGVILLLGWEWYARETLTPRALALLAAMLAAVLAAFGLIKAYKRRWLFAGRNDVR